LVWKATAAGQWQIFRLLKIELLHLWRSIWKYDASVPDRIVLFQILLFLALVVVVMMIVKI
jgi:hypothetical protein